jgi:type I restriction enzyme S subunit
MADQTTTIPKGWKMTTLGEAAEILSGGTPSTDSDCYWNGEIPWITPKDLSGYTSVYISKGERNISEEGLKNSSAKKLPKNTVLFSSRAPIGYVAIAEREVATNQGFKNIVCDEKNSHFKYFYYWLLHSKNYIEKLASGSTFSEASANLMRSLKIALPPLPEQRAIAAVLSSLDDKIELLREENKTLEATAQAIFKEWFVNFNFPNSQGKPYRASGGRMIGSELGEIPEGWRVGRIKSLIDVLSGFAFSSLDFSQDGRYKLVTIKNVQDRYFDPETKDKLAELPQKIPDYCKLGSGDILLSLTGNVGRVCLVNGENYVLNQRVAKLKAKNPIDYAFSYLLFLQNSIFSLLQSTASGTAQQNLSPIQTKEIEIVIAERKILDLFGAIANKLIQKINTNNSQIQTLSALRDTLLPKLMKGEIRVKSEELKVKNL